MNQNTRHPNNLLNSTKVGVIFTFIRYDSVVCTKLLLQITSCEQTFTVSGRLVIFGLLLGKIGLNLLFNTYSMKQFDLYYFEIIKMTSQAESILYGEYEPQASILCEI